MSIALQQRDFLYDLCMLLLYELCMLRQDFPYSMLSFLPTRPAVLTKASAAYASWQLVVGYHGQ
jgi:hypothetical protein